MKHKYLLPKFLDIALAASSMMAPSIAHGQDVIPTSVDIRMVQGQTPNQVLLQVKTHSTASFGGVLSALTVTLRYDNSSGSALGAGSSFCNNWSAFPPTPVVLNNGTAYRTYNGFGLSRLDADPFDGGCGLSIPPETWYTITSIPVAGTACTAFTLGNDAFTGANNRDFYLSMNGYNVTGTVVGGALNAGACALDCAGVQGGSAYLDNCNTCVGGTTGLTACVQDCHGTWGGTAHLDNCNTCVGGTTGLTACVQDCHGTWGGTAHLDNCNTCVGGTTGLTACVQDCHGTWGGTAHLDNCGTCVGGTTGLTACVQDCHGTWGGTAYT
ncbi:MAG: hypothetical protein JSS84_08875, partial [Bacteroidetes bacterium]|nr:hypothetical protein [Bacteroidota bacterium]